MGLRISYTHHGACFVWTCDVVECGTRVPLEGGGPPDGWLVLHESLGVSACVCNHHDRTGTCNIHLEKKT